MRYECPPSVSSLVGTNESNRAVLSSIANEKGKLSIGRMLILLNIFSCASGLCFKYINFGPLKYSLAGFFLLLTLAATLNIAFTGIEYSDKSNEHETQPQGQRFRTPLVPYLPALGIFVNWFMMAGIGWVGMVMLVGYVLVGIILYAVISAGKNIGTETRNSSQEGGGDLQEALLTGDNLDPL